jgi:glycosyltransferase involved in cell wall biosynthesis
MSQRRPLIIVSYWYAPSPAVGAKRFSFLAREFTRLGYDVHIITHELRDWINWKTDGTLPVVGAVHRCVESLKLPLPGKGLWQRAVNAVARRLLLKPVGWEYLWAEAATRKALEIARTLPPGVVIATSPTPAALLAGKRIARRLHWPLILDYRDPWSAHEWPAWRRSVIAQWIARRLEGGVVQRSAARVLNTPAMRTSFEKFFAGSDTARNFVIPNGFEAVADAPPPASTGPVHIVHAGEIYTGRSLVPVLEAARRLAARHPARPVRVITFGELPEAEWSRIRAAGLGDFVDERPRIPFTALFAELQRAHLLLAVVGEHMPYSTPYKVYDYMAAGRPILGIAPRGAALCDVLEDSGAGECFESGDIAGIGHFLESFVTGEVVRQRASVERFRWSHLALQYRSVIEQVAAPGTSSHTAPAGRSASARLR